MKNLRILPEVLHDLSEAAEWYDSEGYLGLGDRFIDTFYTYLPCIPDHHEVHRQIYNGFKRILLKPFPYKLYYRVHQSEYLVSLVIHAAREPKLIKEALRNRNL